MILNFIFFCFLAYMLYRLVFNFILPIYRTTKQVKRDFKDMQERMNPYGNQQHQPTPEETDKKKTNLDNVGDYIDFEEVK